MCVLKLHFCNTFRTKNFCDIINLLLKNNTPPTSHYHFPFINNDMNIYSNTKIHKITVLTSRHPGWFWCCQKRRIFRRRIPCRPERTTRVPELMGHRWRRHLLRLSRRLRGPRHSTHCNKTIQKLVFTIETTPTEGHMNTRMTFYRLYHCWCCDRFWLICLYNMCKSFRDKKQYVALIGYFYYADVKAWM